MMHILNKKYLFLALLCLHLQAAVISYPEMAEKSIPEIKRILAAQADSASFDFVVGMKFYNGVNVEKNDEAAFKQFIKAIKEYDDQKAFFPLARLILYSHKQLPKELIDDLSWLIKWVNNDYITARWLMQILLISPHIPLEIRFKIRDYLKNKDTFYTLLKKKIKYKNEDALMINYDIQDTITQLESDNDLKKLFFLHMALGDNENILQEYAQQDPFLAFGLSLCYMDGLGLAINKQKAYEFMLKAVQGGIDDPIALEMLGSYLLDKVNIPADFNEIIKLLKMAAEKGSKEALKYINSAGMQKIKNHEHEIGCELIRYALSKGSFKFEFIGKFSLAQAYAQGQCASAKPEQAQQLYESILASEADDSLLVKGWLHEFGIGTDKNLELAKSYYSKAAQLQNLLKIEKDVAQKNLTRVEEKIGHALEKKNKKVLKKIKKKSSIKHHGPDEPEEEEEEEEQKLSEAAREIDITGYHLQKTFNDAVTYPDNSVITDINTENNVISIHNNYDNSDVVLTIAKQKRITPDTLQKIKKYTYDKRVKDWFGNTAELLKKYTQEQIDRHRFAERVDEIIQLYGLKAIFIKDDGTVEKNKVLPGFIKTADNRRLDGLFEYSYYKDKNKEPILYHRFLHPHSRAQVA